MAPIRYFCFAIFFSGLFLSACNNQQIEDSTSTTDAVLQDEKSGERQGEVKSIDEIVPSYLELKNSLVKTDKDLAADAAKSLAAATSENADEVFVQINKAANDIAYSDNIEQQRKIFYELSKHIYNLVKETDANESVLYKQYCPMAFNNEGAYWLSSEKEVMNPYFGNKMLKCGSVEETIK